MALRKRCAEQTPRLDDGTPNPFYCATAPRCDITGTTISGSTAAVSEHDGDRRQAQGAKTSRRRNARGSSTGATASAGSRTSRSGSSPRSTSATTRRCTSAARRGTARSSKVLNRAFGSLILHEITAHRIEQFKRERLAGKWRGHGQKARRSR